MMRRERCLCGVTIVAPSHMDAWPEHVLAHVRTQAHRDWAARTLSEQQPVVTLFDNVDAYERRRVA